MDLIVKKSQIFDMFSSILTNGINLELQGKIDELNFLMKMHRFVNKRGKLLSYIEECRITIETLWFDPLLIIEVEEGIMSVIPITDDGFYDAFIEIINFFNHMKQKKKPIKVPDPNEFEWI